MIFSGRASSMANEDSSAYDFGPFRLDAVERLLHRNGELIPLPPKVATTLLVLVTNAGRMVEKDDLMKAVWPDTFVEEGALARNISLLRKTLGDAGEKPSYIETIPKRGYRFVAPVRTASEEDRPEDSDRKPVASARLPLRWIGSSLATLVIVLGGVLFYWQSSPQPRPRPVPQGNVLAVLPFTTVDSDSSQDYFADGMTQALVTGLTKLGGLRVISLTAQGNTLDESLTVRSVLHDPAVNRVLTGTILRSGGRVRIDAQLMDPRTRTVQWANYYERDLKDVVALEAELAEAIAREIHVTVTAEQRQRLQRSHKVAPAALDLYLRGRYLWNRRTEESLRRAVGYFQDSIKADPAYPPPYAGLAESYALLGSIGIDGMAPRVVMPKAKAAAEKALALDPELADAHSVLGYVKFCYDWDFPAAAQEFTRALELNPQSATARHWYSHYFMATGDLERAMEEMQTAASLEPLSPSINVGIGWCLYYSKQYDKAIAQYRTVVETDPSLALGHQTLGMAYHQKGMYAEAIEEFQQAASFSSNSPASVAALATAYAASGRLAEAQRERAVLEEMSRHRYVPSFYFASISYALGDTANTMKWGLKAVDERCDYLMYLRVEPRVGALAGNPEFIRILSKIRR
jgi:DNA-binding winged helix-turn-helix (wHTH) protein/TolB-like protein/Tfp pilus assembly protein PilF